MKITTTPSQVTPGEKKLLVEVLGDSDTDANGNLAGNGGSMFSLVKHGFLRTDVDLNWVADDSPRTPFVPWIWRYSNRCSRG